MAAPIEITHVNHSFGDGSLRKQILFDVSTEIRAGEIVIVTGPSGSGKTTLLTLIGALRRVQEGSVRILDEELNGAATRVVGRVRTQVGYIFQAHNLLDALTATQNVQMSLLLHRQWSRGEIQRRAVEMLEAVGLGDRLDHFPSQMSGGQKQRVAIARALAARPRIILADEPTASLDKQSGRDVVTLMHDLAKRDGVTVLLVTHDNRILDVADRIIHLEDGRLSSFTNAVTSNTQHMMDMLAQQNRKGELARHVAGLSVEQFAHTLAEATAECEQFLRVVEMSNTEAFESMLEQTLEAFTLKIGEILAADRVSLFLVDQARGELFSKVAQGDGGKPLDIRVPLGSGIAGRVAASGAAMNIPDAYAEPLFNRAVDQATGYRTRAVLCVPIVDRSGAVFAVAQVLNRGDGAAFDARDETRLRDFAASLGIVLASWSRMARQHPLSRGEVAA
ncbi:MAG: ATP-binding cassette domain-containing protein [Candidatus Binatia bacterium]